MKSLDKQIDQMKKNISKAQKTTFITSMIIGILTHLYALTNNYLYHDSSDLFGLGSTYQSGRWGLGLINDVLVKFNLCYVSPGVNGILSIILIAITGMIIIKVFNIKSCISAALIGGVLVVFPAVTSTFAYMFTAPAYFLALLLAVKSIDIIYKKQSVFRWLIGGLVLSFAIGIYQAYFCVAIAMGFLIVLYELYIDNLKLKEIIIKGIWILGILIGGLVEYVLLNKLLLCVKNIELLTYQGMNEIGTFDLSQMPFLIKRCYSSFLHFRWEGINPGGVLEYILISSILISILLAVFEMYQKSKSYINIALFIFGIIISPLAINSVYLMSANEQFKIHGVMLYSLVFVYVFIIVILEHATTLDRMSATSRAGRIVSWILIALFLVNPLFYIYSNNQAYLKMNLIQEEANSYFNVLISEIKGTEGYTDEMPVAFIGAGGIEDESIYQLPIYETSLMGYAYSCSDLINNYVWYRYMSLYTGFAPTILFDVPDTIPTSEVKAMPCYPDQGSIKVINGTVIVKCSEQ